MLLSRFIFQGNVLAYIGDNVPVPTFFTVRYLILEGEGAIFFIVTHMRLKTSDSCRYLDLSDQDEKLIDLDFLYKWNIPKTQR